MEKMLRRMGASAFSVLLCALLLLGVFPMPSHGVEEEVREPLLATASNTLMVGIDVSSWQETIDWAKVKQSGVQQAFLRLCSHSGGTYSEDSYLKKNIAGATANGIPIGAYFFSYAQSMTELRDEAQMILDLLADYPATFALPIVFDCEQGISESIATQACVEFCKIMRDNGYYPMVYASTSWFNSIIDTTELTDIDFWQAHYRGVPAGVTPSELASYADIRPTINNNDANVTIWQCTSQGTVSGCSGSSNIDMNIFYKDYTKIIPVQGYNGYAAADPITVHPSSSLTTAGDKVPSNCNGDPNVLITGLAEDVTLKAFWGLESLESNKNNVLINGRSWTMWDTKSQQAIERLWVYPAEVGSYYLGFDLNDPDALRLPGQSGEGEVLQSIVLKKGFQLVTTTDGSFGTDVQLTDSNCTVVGTLTNNVMLDLRDGKIRVGIDGIETVYSAEQYGKVVTSNASSTVNIRSERNTSDDSNILGVANPGDELIYLGEIVDNWAKVSYGGKEAWISADYFQETGPKKIVTDLKIPGYRLQEGKAVQVNVGNTLNVRSTPDSTSTTNKLGVASGGDKLPYLGEQSGTWYKVTYDGQTGWISSNYSTLVSDGVEVIPLNAAFADDQTPPISSSDSSGSASEPPADSSSADSSGSTGSTNEPPADNSTASSATSGSEPTSSTPSTTPDPVDPPEDTEDDGIPTVVTVSVLGGSLAVGVSGGVFFAFKKRKF